MVNLGQAYEKVLDQKLNIQARIQHDIDPIQNVQVPMKLATWLAILYA